VDMALDAAKSLQVSPTPMLWAGLFLSALGALLFLVRHRGRGGGGVEVGVKQRAGSNARCRT
jgi:hypothetical protein